jgi:hypothetical protein
MKIIKLWEIHEWDGGEHQIYRGKAAETEAAAKEISGKHDAIIARVHRVYEGAADMRANSVAELRKKALAKLTPEEIDALGLKS